MDRIIEQKKGIRRAFTPKVLPYWIGTLIACILLLFIIRGNVGTLRVNKTGLAIEAATLGEFKDYMRVTGQVQPMTTIQLSPLEGGIVQQIVVEEGSHVRKGDAIVILSNDNLDLQILNSEAELAEKENILRNTMISMEQQKLQLRQEILRLQVDVRRYKRAYDSSKALFAGQSETFRAVIRKVYPEVRDGKFRADFRFIGTPPANIRAGQTYYLNLQLGQPEQALLIPKDSFFQKTGGRWIYVLTPDGSKAVKREIKIGRQNPKYYEVTEGLAPGERVVLSGYDNFADKDQLLLR